MSAIAIVSAEVDQELKDQATAIYAAAGLTISKAFRMLLVQTVAERALPFHSFRPQRRDYKRESRGCHRATLDSDLL